MCWAMHLMTYSHSQREFHHARVTIFLCTHTHTLYILFFMHVFWKKWPWIVVSSFLLTPRMIHCLLSLQLNSTLEYQKVKTLFSNNLIHLERPRITSLQQNLVSGAFRCCREATFPVILRWSSFHSGLTMTPDSPSYLSSPHAVQFSSSTTQFSQAQSPSEPQWPQHCYQTITPSQSPSDTL